MPRVRHDSAKSFDKNDAFVQVKEVESLHRIKLTHAAPGIIDITKTKNTAVNICAVDDVAVAVDLLSNGVVNHGTPRSGTDSPDQAKTLIVPSRSSSLTQQDITRNRASVSPSLIMLHLSFENAEMTITQVPCRVASLEDNSGAYIICSAHDVYPLSHDVDLNCLTTSPAGNDIVYIRTGSRFDKKYLGAATNLATALCPTANRYVTINGTATSTDNIHQDFYAAVGSVELLSGTPPITLAIDHTTINQVAVFTLLPDSSEAGYILKLIAGPIIAGQDRLDPRLRHQAKHLKQTLLITVGSMMFIWLPYPRLLHNHQEYKRIYEFVYSLCKLRHSGSMLAQNIDEEMSLCFGWLWFEHCDQERAVFKSLFASSHAVMPSMSQQQQQQQQQQQNNHSRSYSVKLRDEGSRSHSRHASSVSTASHSSNRGMQRFSVPSLLLKSPTAETRLPMPFNSDNEQSLQTVADAMLSTSLSAITDSDYSDQLFAGKYAQIKSIWCLESHNGSNKLVDATGQINARTVLNKSRRVMVPEYEHGSFFSGDAYIVHVDIAFDNSDILSMSDSQLSLLSPQKKQSFQVLFLWIGKDHPEYNLATAKEVNSQMQVSESIHLILSPQSQEPHQFLFVLGGRIIIRNGTRRKHYTKMEETESRIRELRARFAGTTLSRTGIHSIPELHLSPGQMYVAHGRSEAAIRVEEVPFSAAALCSAHSYIIIPPASTTSITNSSSVLASSCATVWYGLGSTTSERQAALWAVNKHLLHRSSYRNEMRRQFSRAVQRFHGRSSSHLSSMSASVYMKPCSHFNDGGSFMSSSMGSMMGSGGCGGTSMHIAGVGRSVTMPPYLSSPVQQSQSPISMSRFSSNSSALFSGDSEETAAGVSEVFETLEPLAFWKLFPDLSKSVLSNATHLASDEETRAAWKMRPKQPMYAVVAFLLEQSPSLRIQHQHSFSTPSSSASTSDVIQRSQTWSHDIKKRQPQHQHEASSENHRISMITGNGGEIQLDMILKTLTSSNPSKDMSISKRTRSLTLSIPVSRLLPQQSRHISSSRSSTSNNSSSILDNKVMILDAYSRVYVWALPSASATLVLNAITSDPQSPRYNATMLPPIVMFMGSETRGFKEHFVPYWDQNEVSRVFERHGPSSSIQMDPVLAERVIEVLTSTATHDCPIYKFKEAFQPSRSLLIMVKDTMRDLLLIPNWREPAQSPIHKR
ncbi:hypothetical protein GQ42DRAFT_179006 [Ramicandelaber brevisporus]|nr:hypothetical protein GQ42DRAFT_179006 [Ramicandelaber brevisporus]